MLPGAVRAPSRRAGHHLAGAEFGITGISGQVTEVNGRARAFYRRLGFVPTGGRQLVRPDEPDLWKEELALRSS